MDNKSILISMCRLGAKLSWFAKWNFFHMWMWASKQINRNILVIINRKYVLYSYYLKLPSLHSGIENSQYVQTLFVVWHVPVKQARRLEQYHDLWPHLWPLNAQLTFDNTVTGIGSRLLLVTYCSLCTLYFFSDSILRHIERNN